MKLSSHLSLCVLCLSLAALCLAKGWRTCDRVRERQEKRTPPVVCPPPCPCQHFGVEADKLAK